MARPLYLPDHLLSPGIGSNMASPGQLNALSGPTQPSPHTKLSAPGKLRVSSTWPAGHGNASIGPRELTPRDIFPLANPRLSNNPSVGQFNPPFSFVQAPSPNVPAPCLDNAPAGGITPQSAVHSLPSTGGLGRSHVPPPEQVDAPRSNREKPVVPPGPTARDKDKTADELILERNMARRERNEVDLLKGVAEGRRRDTLTQMENMRVQRNEALRQRDAVMIGAQKMAKTAMKAAVAEKDAALREKALAERQLEEAQRELKERDAAVRNRDIAVNSLKAQVEALEKEAYRARRGQGTWTPGDLRSR